jgi:serine/threonine protein kinase
MAPKLKERYIPIKSLGEGGEGKAWLARDSRARCNIVIKIRHLRNTRKEISNEVNLSLGLMKKHPQSPNLCAVFDYELSSSQASIMIEYCDGGNLRRVLEKMQYFKMKGFAAGSTPASFVLHTMCHLGAALLWLHCGLGYHLNSGIFETLTRPWNPIYHRDIKPDNILVRMTGKFERGTRYPDIILADFGLGATKYSYTTV